MVRMTLMLRSSLLMELRQKFQGEEFLLEPGIFMPLRLTTQVQELLGDEIILISILMPRLFLHQELQQKFQEQVLQQEQERSYQSRLMTLALL